MCHQIVQRKIYEEHVFCPESFALWRRERTGRGRGGRQNNSHFVPTTSSTVQMFICPKLLVELATCKSSNRKKNVLRSTVPLFFPFGSSSSTPSHVPSANWVGPTNKMVPGNSWLSQGAFDATDSTDLLETGQTPAWQWIFTFNCLHQHTRIDCQVRRHWGQRWPPGRAQEIWRHDPGISAISAIWHGHYFITANVNYFETLYIACCTPPSHAFAADLRATFCPLVEVRIALVFSLAKGPWKGRHVCNKPKSLQKCLWWVVMHKWSPKTCVIWNCSRKVGHVHFCNALFFFDFVLCLGHETKSSATENIHCKFERVHGSSSFNKVFHRIGI